MEEKLRKVGCFIWALFVVFAGIAWGWASQCLLSKLTWMPNWASAVLGIVVGLIATAVAGIASLMLLSILNPEVESVYEAH